MKQYLVIINADFMKILSTENALMQTDEEIIELLDKYNNFELWKAKFLVNS